MERRIRSYRDLVVYQVACELKLQVYRATMRFPKAEIFGLVSQMRRAATSVSSNIAEGYRRKTRSEYLQFLMIAHGSCSELDDQLRLSIDLGYIPEALHRELRTLNFRASRLLTRLITALKNPPRRQHPRPPPIQTPTR